MKPPRIWFTTAPSDQPGPFQDMAYLVSADHPSAEKNTTLWEQCGTKVNKMVEHSDYQDAIKRITALGDENFNLRQQLASSWHIDRVKPLADLLNDLVTEAAELCEGDEWVETMLRLERRARDLGFKGKKK